ncbi:MAG TPA: rhomboid family intramembrane serine protease [Flavisolibacter sp.]|nr:rhomboid family intramembrane serine protease [Flavisolibacter sp.]
MKETISQTTDNTFKKYIPIVTAICCVTSIALFIGINLEGELDNWDVYKMWGAPPAADIFNGDFWGLFTSNFLHVEIWHIAFNLYWLWILGKRIEFESKKMFYVFLILSSALVSSLAQLAFSDGTGIGLSGIGYALFGFLYVKSRTVEEYRNYLDKKTINLFFFWLMLCVVLTKTGVWTIGNAAHIGGLFWGALIAYISKYDKYVRYSTGFIYLGVLTILILRGPFSTSYLSYQAYELHKNEKVEEAIVAYKKILRVDPDSEFARENLKQLELHQLAEKALDLHTKQKYSEARELYMQILNIDKENAWAKENLSRLPNQ